MEIKLIDENQHYGCDCDGKHSGIDINPIEKFGESAIIEAAKNSKLLMTIEKCKKNTCERVIGFIAKQISPNLIEVELELLMTKEEYNIIKNGRLA